MAISFSWSVVGSASGGVSALAEAADEALRDWALEVVSGDLAQTADGDALFNSGLDGIASDLLARFQTMLEEWYLDLTIGFPWLQEVLGQKPDLGKLRKRVEDEALACPGVVKVESASATVNGRELFLSFEATVDTGKVIAVQIAQPLGGS